MPKPASVGGGAGRAVALARAGIAIGSTALASRLQDHVQSELSSGGTCSPMSPTCSPRPGSPSASVSAQALRVNGSVRLRGVVGRAYAWSSAPPKARRPYVVAFLRAERSDRLREHTRTPRGGPLHRRGRGGEGARLRRRGGERGGALLPQLRIAAPRARERKLVSCADAVHNEDWTDTGRSHSVRARGRGMRQRPANERPTGGF